MKKPREYKPNADFDKRGTPDARSDAREMAIEECARIAEGITDTADGSGEIYIARKIADEIRAVAVSRPERGPMSRLDDVPTDVLATRLVSGIIMCAGNLNKIQTLAETLIRELRGEPQPTQAPVPSQERNTP